MALEGGYCILEGRGSTESLDGFHHSSLLVLEGLLVLRPSWFQDGCCNSRHHIETQ